MRTEILTDILSDKGQNHLRISLKDAGETPKHCLNLR